MVKVLIPLDGSKRSLHAMEDGLRLLSGAKLEVTLLAVQHTGFENVDEDRVREFDDDEDDEIFPTEDSAARMLDEAAKACKRLGVDPHLKLRQGRVVKEVLAEAAEHDLLIMHALDRTGIKEALRMSATEKLARRARCHVLLVED